MGGEDEALSPAQYDAVTMGSIDAIPEAVAAGALPRGSVGVYRVGRGADGPERSIGVLDGAIRRDRSTRCRQCRIPCRSRYGIKRGRIAGYGG
jgi:hypothetical protein